MTSNDDVHKQPRSLSAEHHKNVTAELLLYFVIHKYDGNKSIIIPDRVDGGMFAQSKVPETVSNLITTLSNCMQINNVAVTQLPYR